MACRVPKDPDGHMVMHAPVTSFKEAGCHFEIKEQFYNLEGAAYLIFNINDEQELQCAEQCPKVIV